MLGKEVYEDAARSVRLVRSRATEYGIDANRFGFIGFSAGGEVAGMMETKFDAGNPNATDPIERASSRPDFKISDLYVLSARVRAVRSASAGESARGTADYG